MWPKKLSNLGGWACLSDPCVVVVVREPSRLATVLPNIAPCWHATHVKPLSAWLAQIQARRPRADCVSKGLRRHN